MRNYLNYALSLMILPALYGCLNEKKSSHSESESKLQSPPKNNIIYGAYIPDRPETNFNVYIQMDKLGSCSGSLISPTFILTAAHCMKDVKPSDVSVTAQADAVTQPTFRTNLPAVKDVYVHPNYGEAGNDIALIELSSAADSSLKPVALFNGTIPEEGVFAVEAYGYSPYIWSLSRDLLGFLRGEEPVNFPGNVDALGTRRLQGKLLSAAIFKDSSTISILQLNGGICSGDSGGPVVVNIDGKKTQVGINTAVAAPNGLADCNSLAVVTQVNGYMSWIEEKMQDRKSDLVKNKFDTPEQISEAKTLDQTCAQVEGLVVTALLEKADKIKEKTCDQDLVTTLEQAVEYAKISCISDIARSYPLTLTMTIQALKKDCK